MGDKYPNQEVQLLWEIAQAIAENWEVTVNWNFANGEMPNSVVEGVDAILRALKAIRTIPQ